MLHFGVGGFPPAFERTAKRTDRATVFRWLRSLGLEAVELQMTFGPRSSPLTCRSYRQAAELANIAITVHASYFIVLTSSDPAKIDRSIDTLHRTFDLASELGATVVVLHPGSAYGADRQAAEENLRVHLRRFLSENKRPHIGLFLETAGKVNQFGSVDEILRVTEEFDGCFPCIDFGHVHARTFGSLASPKGLDALCDRLKKSLESGRNARIHFHYTPIDYGPGGERSHKSIVDVAPIPNHPADSTGGANSKFPHPGELFAPRPEHVAAALRAGGFDGIVISETHNSQEIGALALREAYFNSSRKH